jgi:hypothetical protein
LEQLFDANDLQVSAGIIKIALISQAGDEAGRSGKRDGRDLGELAGVPYLHAGRGQKLSR